MFPLRLTHLCRDGKLGEYAISFECKLQVPVKLFMTALDSCRNAYTYTLACAIMPTAIKKWTFKIFAKNYCVES